MGLQLVVGKDAGFLQAVHPLTDLKIDVAFGVKVRGCESVLVDDGGGNVLAVYAHVLVDGHVRYKEKILEVSSAVASTMFGVRNGAVEM